MTDIIIKRLQRLYDGEINIKLEWFWDGGIDATLGDHMNGWHATGNFETVTEAIDFLEMEAIKRWPLVVEYFKKNPTPEDCIEAWSKFDAAIEKEAKA